MEKQDLERAGAIALNRIFGYEPAISRAITDTFGCSDAVFKMSAADIRKLFGPFSKHSTSITSSALDDAKRELKWLQGCGYQFISRMESCFPALLNECQDAPAGLYIRSGTPASELFTSAPHVAIVGTRDPSPYGTEWCNRLVSALSQTKRHPVIVSGLALGIDICAHLSALGHSLATIAVLPTSVDDVYPRSHSVAAAKIASKPGCALISDFPPGTGARGVTFLRRNRIIAGLSGATVLVESKIKGGGTITTRYAAEYGREAYALPGRIDDIRSGGCNRMIAEKVAEPVSSLENLVRELGLGQLAGGNKADFGALLELNYPGSEILKNIGLAIKRHRGINIDELCRTTGLPYSTVAAACGTLQNDKLIDIDLLQRCTVKIY